MADNEGLRDLASDLMLGRVRKNSYTQGGNRKYFFGKPDNTPGNTTQKGYSDCSSAVQAAIQAAAGIDIGSNTNAQIKNRANGVVVDETSGYYPDESKLLPGDCLYFKGNTSHTLDVGHVEMYVGGGQCCGHGSGTGPTVKNLREYCKSRATSRRRYFMAIRWIADQGDGGVPDEDSTLGSRLLKRGSSGTDVRDLQTYLLELGYELPKYGADGYYGAETEEAVKQFQRAHDLDADGDYGPLTHAALMAALDALNGDAPTDEDDGDTQPAVPIVAITGGSVYARKGPDTSYGIITIVHEGETYPHIATARNGWYCIAIGDTTAWVSNKYSVLQENEIQEA